MPERSKHTERAERMARRLLARGVESEKQSKKAIPFGQEQLTASAARNRVSPENMTPTERREFIDRNGLPAAMNLIRDRS